MLKVLNEYVVGNDPAHGADGGLNLSCLREDTRMLKRNLINALTFRRFPAGVGLRRPASSTGMR
jgi:hypothetical protein